MTLSAGTRLGPYEIQAAIGTGGMAEVYQARDTRLDSTGEQRRTGVVNRLNVLMVVALAAIIPSARGMEAQRQTTPPTAVSVEQEPRHRPVFENAFARLLDVRVPAGDTTLYHTHSHYMAGVVLETAMSWEQVLGAERQAPSAGDPALAGSESTDRVLERLDREWTQAEIRGDVVAIGRFLTEDFISVNPVGGVSDKQQFLADYRTGDLDIESERLDGYVIRVHGETAVMVHTATLQGTYRGVRIDGRNRSMHVWRKTHQGWLMAASQGTPIR